MASMFQGVARDIEHFVRDIPIQYRIIRFQSDNDFEYV